MTEEESKNEHPALLYQKLKKEKTTANPKP